MIKSADLKIDLNARSKSGYTAFHYDCLFLRKEMVAIKELNSLVAMMIKHVESSKLDLKVKDKFGKNAFQLAKIYEGHEKKLPLGTF